MLYEEEEFKLDDDCMEVEAFLNEHSPAGNQKDLIVREQKILGFWIENLANNRNTTQQRWGL